MYYYGYNGYGSSNSNPCCGGGYSPAPQYGYPAGYGTGYGAAIILVLFILLVIVFGAGFLNNNNN